MSKVIVLISGRGSNLVAILNAGIKVDAVISDTLDAIGLQLAESRHIPNHYAHHEGELLKLLKQYSPELVALAGYMSILSSTIVNRYNIINIHPSLLPKYKGLNTHIKVLESDDEYHGCTVHRVTPKLDSGEVLARKEVYIENCDTPGTLQAKVLIQEHIVYPEAIELELARILVHKLEERAKIRRGITTRKSVQLGEPDRISDLLEEAASIIRKKILKIKNI